MNYIDFGVFHLRSSGFHDLYPEKDEDGMVPQTRALIFCMHTCGIQKLFTRDDFDALIFRLALSHFHLNVLDNFFGQDFLFDFEHENKWHRVGIDDLIAHIGLHVTRYPDVEMPFDKWQSNISRNWSDAMLISAVSNLTVPGFHKITQKTEDDVITFTPSSMEHRPTEETIRNARILTENVMKDIPTDYFNQFASAHHEKLKEIEEYLVFAKSPLPVAYSWETISAEAQQAVIKHFAWKYSKDIPSDATIDDIEQQIELPVSRLVYLAWLVANGFVYELALADFDPRVDIDISDYGIFEYEAGINLQNIYDDYELEEFEPFLKEHAV